MDSQQLTLITAPVIASYILGFIFSLFAPDGDPGKVPNMVKKLSAVIVGMGLALLSLMLQGLPTTLQNVTTYLLFGFVNIGCASIGVNQLPRAEKGISLPIPPAGVPVTTAAPTGPAKL
jgi:predicted permease